ncbi:aminotransferase class V-fold PLP-dependent enzyme [Sphingobacteriales bacterium UPWRP_1]|nr:cystathionine beta-lyase [Sphingobacteriales bacterium TSM_CSM]PSJ72896.1 aminotransferase class V-fold PLP-dependent enzyme [Sphingobacteriales bacterium UPWRP_1]
MDLSYILNHLGEERQQYRYAVSPPVFQSSNFTFPDIAVMRRSLQDEMNTPFYTRGCNPTVAMLRQKVAALEKAEDALIFSSGSAAIAAAVLSQVKAGDHIVCVQKPYSWTNKLLNNFLPRFGVQATMVDGTDAQNYRNALQPNTRLLFLESPNSITFELQDIEAVVRIAKEHHLVTVIDNSYATPIYQNPIEMGVDIVTHSASKYLGGHSDIVAGVLCGSKQMVQQIFESEFMTLGGIISPHDAWLMIRGLRTLPLRLQKVSETTARVVAFLEQQPWVKKVYYPFSPSHPQHQLARKQMKGCGGLFSVELNVQTLEEVETFCNNLRYFILACSWGGYESLVFPMCVLYTSQNYMQVQSQLPFNLIRLYIGLEDADTLISDLEQAYGHVQSLTPAGMP